MKRQGQGSDRRAGHSNNTDGSYRYDDGYQNASYCWTCGLNNSHVGRDCWSRAAAHQNDEALDSATRHNRMGGSVRHMHPE